MSQDKSSHIPGDTATGWPWFITIIIVALVIIGWIWFGTVHTAPSTTAPPARVVSSDRAAIDPNAPRNTRAATKPRATTGLATKPAATDASRNTRAKAGAGHLRVDEC